MNLFLRISIILAGLVLLGAGCAGTPLPPPVFDRPYNYPGNMSVDPLPDDKQSVTIGVLDFTPDANPDKMPYITPDFNMSKYFTDILIRMLGDKKINIVPLSGKTVAADSAVMSEEMQNLAKDGVDYYLIGNIQECRFIDCYTKSAGAIKVTLQIKLFHIPSKSVVFSKLGLFAYESVVLATEIYKTPTRPYPVEYPRVTTYRYESIPENEISPYFENVVFNAIKAVINDPAFIEKIIK